jgi:hypothetical protein
MATLYETLGFKVEDKQVKTFETRKDSFDNVVPQGVRPATHEEIKMWDLLERRF